MKSPIKCLVPKCNIPVLRRGLCSSHYQCAHRLVQLGKTTWDKLEKAGKALAPKPYKGRGSAGAAFFLAK